MKLVSVVIRYTDDDGNLCTVERSRDDVKQQAGFMYERYEDHAIRRIAGGSRSKTAVG